MRSPFPGIDPCLEGRQWTGVHTALSVEIAHQLTPHLSPRYVARTNERRVVTVPDPEDTVAVSTSGIYPDAYVAGTTAPAAGGPLTFPTP